MTLCDCMANKVIAVSYEALSNGTNAEGVKQDIRYAIACTQMKVLGGQLFTPRESPAVFFIALLIGQAVTQVKERDGSD